jgi:hypothetical protein
MPDNQRAIADTSVLIAFDKLNKLDLLCLTYKEIFLPEAVYQEYANDLQNCFILKTAPEPISDFLINHVGLGRGESESIALAHSMGTRVLIDDLKARKIALDFGCRVTSRKGEKGTDLFFNLKKADPKCGRKKRTDYFLFNNSSSIVRSVSRSIFFRSPLPIS